MRKIKGIKFFVISFVVIICILLFFKELFIFSLVFALASMLQAFSYRGDIKYNLGHVFFLSIIIQKSLGTTEAIILLVFAGFLPKMFSGEVDLKSLISLPLEIVIILTISAFEWNIGYGILAAFLNYAAIFFMARFSGESVPEIIAEVILPLIMNIIYFISLSGILDSLIGYVILI